jgi:hypothetical protein
MIGYLKNIIIFKKNERGHKMSYISEMTGIPYKNLQKFFKNDNVCPVDTIERLMKFYNLVVVQEFNNVENGVKHPKRDNKPIGDEKNA